MFLPSLCILLVLAFNLLSLHTVHAEVEISVDGTANAQTGELSVRIRSDYGDVMSLFWSGNADDDDPVFILDLQQGVDAVVNTFVGHSFFARSPSGERATPERITISEGARSYSFSPDGGITKVAPSKAKAEPKQRILPIGSEGAASNVTYRDRDPAVNSGMHPGVSLLNSGTTAMSVKFKNLAPELDYYYDDGRDGIYQGRMSLGAETTTNTYEGHVFYFTALGDKSRELARFTMNRHQVMLVIRDPSHPPPKQLADLDSEEQAFASQYLAENGIHWRHYYGKYSSSSEGSITNTHIRPADVDTSVLSGPRSPPELHMWEAQEVGQVHTIHSSEGFWCYGSSSSSSSSSDDDDGGTSGEQGQTETQTALEQQAEADRLEWGRCPSNTKQEKKTLSASDKGGQNQATGGTQQAGPVTLELEVVSLEPRVFLIESFLSDYEVDSIIELSRDRLRDSTVGNGDSGSGKGRSDSTRTSKNTWLSRDSSAVTETLFMRAADVLQVDQSLLQSSQCAEEMQVVNYQDGQKYDSHHDWGVNGFPESRFITLLLYLTDQPSKSAGGETAFPKAAGGAGIKIHPGKGAAVLFYNLLEDGNGDDLALHAALPVLQTHEKWLANYWVWDKKRR